MSNTSAQTSLEGNGWSALKVDEAFIVSIHDQCSIIDSLTDFINSEKITAGQITGIGAINEASLRFFDPITKEYVDKVFTEQMELANISGNISVVENKTIIHVHVTLGKSDYTALAGHLLDAKIRGAGEIFIYPLNGVVNKTKNPDIGLNIYDFCKL